MKPNHDIDPRTTRRTVPLHEYKRNSALYAQYELIGYDDWTNHDGTPGSVVLQKKPEFCHPQKQQHDDPDDTASGLDAEREKANKVVRTCGLERVKRPMSTTGSERAYSG